MTPTKGSSRKDSKTAFNTIPENFHLRHLILVHVLLQFTFVLSESDNGLVAPGFVIIVVSIISYCEPLNHIHLEWSWQFSDQVRTRSGSPPIVYHQFKLIARSNKDSTWRIALCFSCCFNILATDSGSSPCSCCASVC